MDSIRFLEASSFEAESEGGFATVSGKSNVLMLFQVVT
jgi:hypothetical protein